MNHKEMKELRDWANNVHKGCAENMKSSVVYAGVLTKGFMDDPVCALQIGLAVLYDKPIVIIAEQSMTIPPGLKKIADLIERVDTNSEEGMAKASAAIKAFLKKTQGH